jgi:hypothetical protein
MDWEAGEPFIQMLCNMKNRTRQLVAWTENGRVRMIPSLVEQFSQPFIARIEDLESRRPHDFREQPQYLMELSRAYEALGCYYERLGHTREAFDAYVAAAVEVTRVDDFWWCNCDEGDVLSKPFWGRFFAMYSQCRRLFRQHAVLKDTASYEKLQHEYQYVSAVIDSWDAEFDAAMEISRAWRFGA